MLPQRLVATVELLHRPHFEVLDDHVGPFDQRAERVAVLVGPQIQLQRALAAVDTLEVAAVGFRLWIFGVGRVRPDEVPPGALDFYHVCAHIREQHRTVRSGQDLGQVEHPKVGKRTHSGARRVLLINLGDKSL